MDDRVRCPEEVSEGSRRVKVDIDFLRGIIRMKEVRS